MTNLIINKPMVFTIHGWEKINKLGLIDPEKHIVEMVRYRDRTVIYKVIPIGCSEDLVAKMRNKPLIEDLPGSWTEYGEFKTRFVYIGKRGKACLT